MIGRGGFGRKAGPQFEVPGVKQRALVGLQKELSRTENMSGRKQGGGPAVEDLSFAIGQGFEYLKVSAHPHLHEPGGRSGAKDAPVPGGVVAMRVGNEGEILRLPGVQPEAGLGQKNSAIVCDGDHGWRAGSPPYFPRG